MEVLFEVFSYKIAYFEWFIVRRLRRTSHLVSIWLLISVQRFFSEYGMSSA